MHNLNEAIYSIVTICLIQLFTKDFIRYWCSRSLPASRLKPFNINKYAIYQTLSKQCKRFTQNKSNTFVLLVMLYSALLKHMHKK